MLRSSAGERISCIRKGNDANEGTEKAPFRTIGKAAEYAFPGDVITVHAGTYREWINPSERR